MTGPHTVPLPDGELLKARIDGPSGAPVVVLSNSVMTDLSIWDSQVAMLQTKFQVLRYDQRGHGGSSVPAGPLTFVEYGADLLHLLKTFEVSNCIFVGLSMGVPTGLVAYASAPDRFSGFVAVDGVSRSAPGREAFWRERRETARALGMNEIAGGTVPRWLPGTDADSADAKMLARMIGHTPVEGFAAATHALQSYNLSDVVPQVSCPFLGLAGELDGAMPAAMRNQFDTVPGAQFAEIPDSGHVPNFQQPDAFNAALIAFLETVSFPMIKEVS